MCKRCFYADDIRRKESGLPRALISSGIAAIVLGLVLMIGVGLAGGRAGAMGLLGGGLLAGGVASVREGRRRKRILAGR